MRTFIEINMEVKMKTLEDIQEEMGQLYDRLKDNKINLKLAAEMANVAGKDLKAKQLSFAEKVFVTNRLGGRRR